MNANRHLFAQLGVRGKQWLKEIDSLGFVSTVLFKIQNQRLRLGGRRPVLYRAKYANFPLYCRPNTTDHAVFRQIFVDREYRCLDEVKDAQLIIDCGANVGYSSAFFLSRFPKSHLVAVEPDPEN